MTKHVREISKLASKFGRMVEHRKSGHLALVDPTGDAPKIFTSTTPSCPFKMRKLRADLEKYT